MAGLRARLISAYFGIGLRDTMRSLRRATRRGRRELTYVHQLDDPHGLLLLARLPALVEAAEFELRVLVIPTPPPACMPDHARWRSWACADARLLAASHGLAFPDAARPPPDAALERAQALALGSAQLGWRERVDFLQRLGLALFSDQPLPAGPAPTASELATTLAANQARVHARGHYQGGVLHYEGEWYWGLDRLELLRERLRDEGVELPSPPEAQPTLPRIAADARVLELFFSFRSPYSYLAFQRTRALATRHALELRVRPVLPMVMRGLPVPLAKRLYIVRDCARVAARAGIPFGRVADPVGRGVERCMGVAQLAAAQGPDRLLEWIHSASTGIWSEGVRVATDAGIELLARRAGLDPQAALEAAGGPDAQWRAEAEVNREALLAMGLWGVPCFRLGELTLWGQDRIELLDAVLRARARD